MTPDFERAQNTATRLLLRQDIDSLYMDVRRFRFDRNIVIDSIQNYCQITGRRHSDFLCEEHEGCCVLKTRGMYLILYDDSETNESRKHWGIAHEVGHIYLGHEDDGKKEEVEAHFFAAQVIVPEVAMAWVYKFGPSLSAELLVNYFNISWESAEKRIQTFLRRRGINFNEIDRALLRKLAPFLSSCWPLGRRAAG